MGIYIKHMKMPNSCVECPLYKESVCDAFETLAPYTFKDNERASFCPLTEVAEPSGDLISRDKLNECIKHWYEHMGVDIHGVWNKQLAEIVKGMDEDDLALEFRFLRESIGALPSAEAEPHCSTREVSWREPRTWIEKNSHTYICGDCGFEQAIYGNINEYNYCPRCGVYKEYVDYGGYISTKENAVQRGW